MTTIKLNNGLDYIIPSKTTELITFKKDCEEFDRAHFEFKQERPHEEIILFIESLLSERFN